MCAISGVLLIAPLLPIVYERWQRYYQLDRDGKRIKAGQNLLREIEKRRQAKDSKKDKKREKTERSKGERLKKNGDVKVTQNSYFIKWRIKYMSVTVVNKITPPFQTPN